MARWLSAKEMRTANVLLLLFTEIVTTGAFTSIPRSGVRFECQRGGARGQDGSTVFKRRQHGATMAVVASAGLIYEGVGECESL